MNLLTVPTLAEAPAQPGPMLGTPEMVTSSPGTSPSVFERGQDAREPRCPLGLHANREELPVAF